MRFMSRSSLVAVSCLVGSSALSAQERTFGVNLRIAQVSSVGVTWQVSPGVALRPALSVSWSKFESLGGPVETTQYGLDVDVLFTAARLDRVTAYAGIGGFIGAIETDVFEGGTVWAARGLFGARVMVLDRVAVFGEIGLEYLDAGDSGASQAGTRTFPIGVIVFLK